MFLFFDFIVEVRKVSRVVNELGLSTKLKYRLAAHKTDMERQKDKLDKEMEGNKVCNLV